MSIIAATWPDGAGVAENWGDALNPVLLGGLSSMSVVNAKYIHGWNDRPVFRAIGSSLASARPNNVIWGTGFINENCTLKHAPAAISAVRGPRTQRRLIELGFPAPDALGDPAILYPLLYWPEIEQRFDVGIIQHFREYGQIPPARFPDGTSVLHIDIRSGIRKVVDAILSCRRIVSSSLHGVIGAHAYGVAAQWLKASDLPLGDDFKFLDYFESIGHDTVDPALPDSDGGIAPCSSPDRPAVIIDGEKLLRVCPFMSQDRRSHFQRRIRSLRAAGRRGSIFNTF